MDQLIPTNSVYEKQDQSASPSSNEADTSLPHSPDENNVMDLSKSNGASEHKQEEEEQEESKYAEEYEDEAEHEEIEGDEQEEENDSSDNDDGDGATKKERSPAETSNISSTEAEERDGDYLEDPPTNQYDNTYYYYDEYDNGNRSRYDAVGEFLLQWLIKKY